VRYCVVPMTWILGVCLLGCSAYDRDLLASAPQFATRTPTPDAGREPSAGSTASSERDASTPISSGSEFPAQPPSNVTRCGDAIISGPEKCDTGIGSGSPGSCPISCPALATCAPRVLNGTACQAECLVVTPPCKGGDSCCPANCNPDSDSDCSRSCGDGTIDGELGETCEPKVRACKQNDAECADEDPCTQDRLVGAPKNCNSDCTHNPITERVAGDGCCPDGANANLDGDCKPVCGNGVRESDEACDGPDCQADCKVMLTPEQSMCTQKLAQNDCQHCGCMACAPQIVACRAGMDASANAVCSALMACVERTHCAGNACYCGSGAVCGVPRGPCQTEVENAAGSTDLVAITALRFDIGSPLGRASTADDCIARSCMDACGLTTGSSARNQ
jgi:hypothetical protein